MKRLCSCGRLVEKGQTCVCQQAARAERLAKADAARPSAAARGYDSDWRRLRAEWLNVNPTCVACGEPAKHVDHIVSIRDAPMRRLDPSNLRSLCHSCHSRRTAKEQAFGRS